MTGPPECRDERAEGEAWPVRAIFESEVGGIFLPARGLVCSVLAHGLFGLVSLYVPWSYWFPPAVHLVTAQSIIQKHEVLLLPDLEPMGGGSSADSSGSSGGDGRKEEARASSSTAKIVQGVVYKGPQLIISNPPHPDNVLQTIRQPDLVATPKLPGPFPLPPMVSIAPSKAMPAPPPPRTTPESPRENHPVQARMAAPIILPQQEPRVVAPKLPLLSAGSANSLLHAVTNTEVPTPMPKLEHPNSPARTGNEEHNILVVDAIPILTPKPATIPPGELHGGFIVSPVPVSARPGATVIGMPGGSPEGKGSSKGERALGGAGIGNLGKGAGSHVGGGNKSKGGGGGNSVRAGEGSGTGSGHGGKGGNGQTGNGSGAGGHGMGSGKGTGTVSGNSPFPSIIIQGGTGGSGRSMAGAPGAGNTKAQTSYGITIVASGASGGGFKDFGVFRDEASYTVYLDMADAGAYGSSWALQYALDSHGARNTSDAPAHLRGLLVPPYAISKSLPHFSAEAARRGRGGMIVVFGVINPQGKFQDLRIMQSPDAELNQVLLESLRKWVFKPAGIDGEPVSVKTLLGIPVNAMPE